MTGVQTCALPICIESVTEELYAITTERRIRHPATVAVSEAATKRVFGSPVSALRGTQKKRA